MRVEAIVVAAGSGTRMRSETKKPYIHLQGVPLLIHTLRALQTCDLIERFVVVTAGEDRTYAEELIRKYLSGTFQLVSGGAERQDSVRCGLAAISGDADVLLVHDAARPFVNAEEIRNVIEAAWRTGAATLGTPVKDTIKEVENGTAVRTLPRHKLFAIQTPQAFHPSLLREAHHKALIEGVQGTDDASLIEWLGKPVAIIPGSYRNIKITTPEDLVIAEAFMQS